MKNLKKFIIVMLCALSALSATACRHTVKDDDSSTSTTSQTGTGKKSSFVIEEVTD